MAKADYVGVFQIGIWRIKKVFTVEGQDGAEKKALLFFRSSSRLDEFLKRYQEKGIAFEAVEIASAEKFARLIEEAGRKGVDVIIFDEGSPHEQYAPPAEILTRIQRFIGRTG